MASDLCPTFRTIFYEKMKPNPDYEKRPDKEENDKAWLISATRSNFRKSFCGDIRKTSEEWVTEFEEDEAWANIFSRKTESGSRDLCASWLTKVIGGLRQI